MSSCLPCGGPPSETKLLARCYPPAQQQQQQSEKDATSIQPLRSELAELVSTLRDRPGHLGKVGAELEKRVGKDTSRIAGGDAKPRSTLLITLSILKSLIVDFRSDVKPLARPAIRIFQSALDVRDPVRGGTDLEVVGRTISAFVAFMGYARGDTVTADSSLFGTYLLVLRKLASMAVFTPSSEKPNQELRDRIRLIALSGLYAALVSQTLLGASAAEFGKQANVIVMPLLENAFEAPMDQLKAQSDRVEREASDDRRPPSVRAHRPSEKAPTATDVLHLALKSLYDLVASSQTAQVSSIVDAVLAYLDKQAGWQDVERCCWLAERLTEGAMLQYRYVVPTRLIELLVAMPDAAPGPKQTSILAMVMTILNSDISLVGLGVIYILDSLVGLTIRRIRCDPQDALLPPLVQCVASLAAHIYYVDQVNEMVEEIAYRLPDIPSSDTARPHIVRVLIYCMIGVMHVAQRGDEAEARRSSTPQPSAAKGKGPQISGIETPRPNRSKRRSPVSPLVWQDTLPLLCESTYAVRAAYARALILYIEKELPREDRHATGSGDPAVWRFCNALHATIYTLAMSSFLGTGSPAPTPKRQSPVTVPAPLPATSEDTAAPAASTDTQGPSATKDDEKPTVNANGNGDSTGNPTPERTGSDDRDKERHEKGVSFNITEPTPLDTPTGTGQGTPPVSGAGPGGQLTPRKNSRSVSAARRVSLPLNRLNSAAVLDSFENVATPFDYSSIIKILEELYKAVPLSATSTGVPMLLALDADAGNELIRRPGLGDERNGSWAVERRRAIRETVAFSWPRLGQQWGVQELQSLATKAIEKMPEPLVVPTYQPMAEYTILPPPDTAYCFVPHEIEGESSSAAQPLLDRDTLLDALVASSDLQRGSGWDTSKLRGRLDTSWSVENALKNSVDRSGEVIMMLASNGNGNGSTHSFLRPQSRVVDVHDLRLALDGRAAEGFSSRTPSLRSASLRSPTTATTGLEERPRSRLGQARGQHAHADVKEVLKDIFKDKKRSQPQDQATQAVQKEMEVVPNGHAHADQASPPVTETMKDGNKEDGARQYTVELGKVIA